MTPTLGVPRNAGQIHGRNISQDSPSNNQILVWDDDTQKWIPDKTIVSTLGSDDTTVPTSKAVAVALQNRNAIINGDCRVNQRVTAYTLIKDAYTWDASDLYGPDRHEGMATGTAVSAGTWEKTATATAGHSGSAFTFKGVTLTGAGVLWHRTRIEALDAIELKNQIASFGCYVWQDTGSAHNYTIYVRKANAADNFSAVTEIGHSAAQSVPSGGVSPGTFIKFEGLSMGDCSNGIEVEIKDECGAVTTKNFEQTELQLEKGLVCTAFELQTFATILSNCQRYCQVILGGTGAQSSRTIFTYADGAKWRFTINLLTPMMATPTLSHNLQASLVPGTPMTGNQIFIYSLASGDVGWVSCTDTTLTLEIGNTSKTEIDIQANGTSMTRITSGTIGSWGVGATGIVLLVLEL